MEINHNDNYTTLQVSAPIYWGFQYDIQNTRLVSMNHDDLITEVKNTMKSFFCIHNLTELQEGVDKLDLHIHQEIVPGGIVYVCTCDNDEE